MKKVKDQASRRREAENILVQLQDLGFPDELLEKPVQALRDFVDQGLGVTQTYKHPEMGVELLLQLSLQPHVTSFARVRRV